jgi:predicted permease
MSWVLDARFALRMMRKHPFFTSAIVLTLALGIGVNTTIFSLVNAVLLKPLPFPGGERLVTVNNTNPGRGQRTARTSLPDYYDFRDHAKSFEFLEAFTPGSVTISEQANPPERYSGAHITPGMFNMLQVKPVLGRLFTNAESQYSAPDVMLIGYSVWRDRYAKDPAILGRTVRVNGHPFAIIGVLPEGLKFPMNENVWLPLKATPQLERRDDRRLTLIGVRRKGVSLPEAHADLDVIARRLEREYPDSNKGYGVIVRTFHETFNGGQIKLLFLLMLGAVGFVLLIACANVANMLLSRAMARSREMSIRAALGAGRWRVARQLLMESIVLSLAAGLLGLALARWGIEGFAYAVSTVGKPYWIDFTMDYVVFGYFAAVCLAAGVLFGLAPAIRASRIDLNEALKEGSRDSGGSRGGFLSSALVVFQFTLAVVLLTGAGLLMRSFLEHQNTYREIPSGRILSANLALPEQKYPKEEDRQRFFERLLPRLESLPGVQGAAVVTQLPGSGGPGWRFEAEGHPIADPEKRPVAMGVEVSKDYLRLINAPLLSGRMFEESDGLPGKEAVIVSQRFARRFWQNQEAVGKRIRFFRDNQPGSWITIVGVCPEMRQGDPSDFDSELTAFVPYRQQGDARVSLAIRAAGDPAALSTAVRKEVQALDEDMPLFRVMTLEEYFRMRRWQYTVFGTVFMIFAGIALAMAAIGVYAVMAQAANRRTREIGVRIALGAGRSQVLGLVLAQGMLQVGLGVVLGLVAAYGVSRLMSGLLFTVSPTDAPTFLAVAGVLVAAGLLACLLPARRAAALDPVKALRYE